MDGFLLAIQFLTRIPVKKNIKFTRKNLKNAVYFFPFTALIIAVIVTIPFVLIPITEFRVSSALAISIYCLITGSLHLDGLSDTVDGFWGGKDKEDIIKIMKDSRIGAFGVIALILIILTKFAIYTSIANQPHLIIIAIVNSRFSAVHLLNNFKTPNYGGFADSFSKGRIGKGELILLLGYAITMAIYDYKYILSLVLTILFTRIMGRKAVKKIGAVSGDIIGATVEISDILSLITLWVIKWI
ncbi:MAG: adenosylcobinamide-GDP ribazoletransferase [Tissierellia bacterium]|nr:adenosylcobinamide-GDP ribazoletransferase [Tissierellia bacterium]